MKTSSRCLFPSAIALLLTFTLGSPSQAVPSTDRKVIHILDRLSFGPQPGDVANVEKIGVETYIQQQLHPETLPEPPTLTQQLAQLEALNLTPLQLFKQDLPNLQKGQKPTPEQRQAARKAANTVLAQARQARWLRATASPRQLQEVMVNFWYNHFNVFADKGIDRLLVGSYEQDAIRPYALGRFRDLLSATAHHPAMLFYLDNWQNVAPNGQSDRAKKNGLNENYARELMELHTLGVDGGYTQADVVALAKIFTGWTFRKSAQPGVAANGFYFDAKRHDPSDKVFLGQTIKGSGRAEAEQALDRLAKSPATARHLSYQLAQYFIADQPPAALVERLAQKFLATDGNIREVLSTLLHSPEFWATQADRAKFKTPYQYAVSAVRATGLAVTDFRPLNGLLQQLGMPLYGCLTPDGYKNTADVWLNPDALTRRISFATALASGRLPLTTPPLSQITAMTTQTDRVAIAPKVKGAGLIGRSTPLATPIDPEQLATTLGNAFSPQTQQTIATSPPQLRAALILGSPEFMRR